MKPSAWAVLSAEKSWAERTVGQLAARTSSTAIWFQCPAGVTVAGPSAHSSAIRLSSSVNAWETAYTSFISARNTELPYTGGGPGRNCEPVPMFQMRQVPARGSSGGKTLGDGVGAQNSF